MKTKSQSIDSTRAAGTHQRLVGQLSSIADYHTKKSKKLRRIVKILSQMQGRLMWKDAKSITLGKGRVYIARRVWPDGVASGPGIFIWGDLGLEWDHIIGGSIATAHAVKSKVQVIVANNVVRGAALGPRTSPPTGSATGEHT